MKTIALFAAGLCALASTAAVASPTCLAIGQIYNWRVLDDRTLVIEDQFHNRFRASLMGTCQGLNFKERVGFKSMGATDLSCLTAGDDIVIRDYGTGRRVCPIRSIVPYTADLEKADMEAAAAKKAAQESSGH